jgi:hypothetical protein
MEQPVNVSGRPRVSPVKADALLALLHVAEKLSYCDIVVLAGEVLLGKAPTTRLGDYMDEAALAHLLDNRNPPPAQTAAGENSSDERNKCHGSDE